MIKRYRARPGARFRNSDAEKIGRELERLRAEDGPLTPTAIVESARSKSSPLHDYFDWDDSSAAEAWRKDQARHLVNRIEVIIEKDGAETVVPFMVSISFKVSDDEPERQGFVTIEEAMAERGYREQILEDVLGQIKILGAKAAAFRELAEILSKTAAKIQRLFPKEKRNEKTNAGRRAGNRPGRHHPAEL